MKKQNKLLVLLNAFAFLALIGVNFLSARLPLNGKTPGQLSDLYPNLIVPPGFTFSIWGLIYGLLAIVVLRQIVASYGRSNRPDKLKGVQLMGFLFLINCALNIAWLFAWHWEWIGLSVFLMIGLFVSLLGLNAAFSSSENDKTSISLAAVAFQIYQGWISIALIVNVTAYLVATGWNGWGISDEIWALLLVVVGSLLAIQRVLMALQPFHGFVVLWALFGIFVRHFTEKDAPLVLSAAASCFLALTLALGLFYFGGKRNVVKSR